MPTRQELENIITHFKSNKLDIFDRSRDVKVIYGTGYMAISSWFDFDIRNPHGDCSELSFKTYQLLKEKYPDLPLKIMEGDFLKSGILLKQFWIEADGIIIDSFYKEVNPNRKYYKNGVALDVSDVLGMRKFKTSPLRLGPSSEACLGYDGRLDYYLKCPEQLGDNFQLKAYPDQGDIDSNNRYAQLVAELNKKL